MCLLLAQSCFAHIVTNTTAKHKEAYGRRWAKHPLVSKPIVAITPCRCFANKLLIFGFHDCVFMYVSFKSVHPLIHSLFFLKHSLHIYQVFAHSCASWHVRSSLYALLMVVHFSNLIIVQMARMIVGVRVLLFPHSTNIARAIHTFGL